MKISKRQLLEAIKYWGRYLREDVQPDSDGMYELDDAYFSEYIDLADAKNLDPDTALDFFEKFKADGRGQTRKTPVQLVGDAQLECRRQVRKSFSLDDLASIRGQAPVRQPVKKPKKLYDMTGNFDNICDKYGHGDVDVLHDLFDNLHFISYRTEEGKYGTLYHLMAAEDFLGRPLDRHVELLFHDSKSKNEFCVKMWKRAVGDHVKSMENRADPIPTAEIAMKNAAGKMTAKYRNHRQLTQRGIDGKMWGTVDEGESDVPVISSIDEFLDICREKGVKVEKKRADKQGKVVTGRIAKKDETIMSREGPEKAKKGSLIIDDGDDTYYAVQPESVRKMYELNPDGTSATGDQTKWKKISKTLDYYVTPFDVDIKVSWQSEPLYATKGYSLVANDPEGKDISPVAPNVFKDPSLWKPLSESRRAFRW